ncbi:MULTISPECIES: antitoxin [Leptospira]|uniref:type II toxin-antitoxin system antitoxin VapB n=1 Tax=Leptospira TaxID=171 RepID=UPI00024866E1|nr:MULTISPECIES: type II toxin-antitoxin system VapB family antitoxin [Leptospira]MCL8266481.1 type II toxin-antitoxin system VapB family antitoxin [Leptospira weilii]MDL5246041.1 type II toxin-antitoxin system VapB family antitoxin [Leptospira weilii]OMI18547.1 antidote-toxin recognition MazE [Leptospira weilii serovar Heyan]QDK22007.1 AbrB/MazE/SpoVT family DNA-binding domain-containing protein [Leptospira weilii]QDK25946.1 AbrB/MazE/SpoVT family DNA-binding domain-containing protein [Leptos
MNKAKIFKNGDSQAIRLPKDYRFKGKEVYIRKDGDNVILTPIDDAVDRFWNTVNNFSEDLLIDRNQPNGYDKRNRI